MPRTVLFRLMLCFAWLQLACGVVACGSDTDADINKDAADSASPDDAAGDTAEQDSVQDTSAAPDTSPDAMVDTMGRPDGTTDTDADDATTPPVGYTYTQDLWVYEAIEKISPDGARADLTAPLLAALDEASADAVVPLSDGLSFELHRSLGAELIGPNGVARDDVEVLVGVLVGEEGRAVAVIATPTRQAIAPIGVEDRVRLDFSSIAEVQAGDLLSVDLAFLQTYPSKDPAEEADAEGAELLALRMAAERIHYLSVEGEDGALEAGLYTDELVRIEGPPGGQKSMGDGGDFPPKSRPMLDGLRRGVQKCVRRQGLLCVAKFHREFGEGAAESRRLIACNLSNCCESECPPPPPPPAPRCRWGCGKSRTDPHITTFDGASYSLQVVGEFVAARSDGLEVQMRTAPWDDSREVSTTSAVSIGAGGARIEIGPGEGYSLNVKIDGVDRTAELEGGVIAVGDGALLLDYYAAFEDADGHRVFVYPRGGFVDLIVEPADDTTAWVGLFGDNDGAFEDDVALRDGTVLTQPVDDATRYDSFAEDWRLSDAESLFTYASGETTETFTDRTFPDAHVSIDSLSAADRAQAEAMCAGAGVVDPQVLQECVLDVALTGDLEVLWSAQLSDTLVGIETGTRNEDGSLRLDCAEGDQSCVAAHCATSADDVTSGGDSDIGQRFSVSCPAGCDVAGGSVWGVDDYTDDSSICRAAIHAGVLDAGLGGQVSFWISPGLDAYGGSEQNGVTSSTWGSWSYSFTFLGEWSCLDGVDNDGDGDADCADAQCAGRATCP